MVLDREIHQDPDRDIYTSNEEDTVVDNAADELELIAASKRPTRLLPHATVVRTNLEPSVQETTPLKKIWCVKLMDEAHVPEISRRTTKRDKDISESQVPTVGSLEGSAK